MTDLKERIQHAYQRVRDHSAIEQKKQKANYDWFTWENTFETESKLWPIHLGEYIWEWQPSLATLPGCPPRKKSKVSSPLARPIQNCEEDWECGILHPTCAKPKETSCRTCQPTQEIPLSERGWTLSRGLAHSAKYRRASRWICFSFTNCPGKHINRAGNGWIGRDAEP